MKLRFIAIFLFALIVCSCKHHKAASEAGTGKIPPNQTLTIGIFPGWGGSAEAILERKNGKDNLYSTYHEKINGRDTVLTQTTFVNASTADSVFALLEAVQWNADANHGTGDQRTGLNFFMTWKKKRAEKSISWEELKNVSELPADIILVIQMVNRISPPDFKIY